MGFSVFNCRRMTAIYILFFLFLLITANFYVGRPRTYGADPKSYRDFTYDELVALGITSGTRLGDSAWFMWTTVFIGIAVMFIADFMFLNENEFVYDPNYQHWLEKSGYEHYRQ